MVSGYAGGQYGALEITAQLPQFEKVAGPSESFAVRFIFLHEEKATKVAKKVV